MAYAKEVGNGIYISASKVDGYTEVDELPFDRIFREAWKIVDNKVVEDLGEAKAISHELRRVRRDRLFKPLDDIISKQIPGHILEDVEAARLVIREADTELQELIDGKLKLNTLKELLFEHDIITEDQLGERSFENGY